MYALGIKAYRLVRMLIVSLKSLKQYRNVNVRVLNAPKSCKSKMIILHRKI